MSVHPFLFPFGSEERWLSYLKHALNWGAADLRKAKRLIEKNLIPIIRGSEIGDFLGVSPKLVCHMAIAPTRYYRSFKIKKKNGKHREITAPRIFLKTVQRYILDCIVSTRSPNEAAVGFRRGFSTGTGAKLHVGRAYVWNIDLCDFFPSIGEAMVMKVFEEMGYETRAASFLTHLCCLQGRLPQGAPTSPALSNLVFQSIDKKILAVTSARKIVYTRYADDLSFSATTPISPMFRMTVRKLLSVHGFTVNKNKTRLMGPACRREITGLTVNEKVGIPRPVRRKVRAYFHRVSLNPVKFRERKDELLGLANWIAAFHPKEGRRYRAVAGKLQDAAKRHTIASDSTS